MSHKNSIAYLQEHGITYIPKGWTQSRVKYLGTYINGYAFKPDDWGTTGRPILRIQNLSSPEKEANHYDGEISDRYLVRAGDILISWSASLGVYIWRGEDSWLNQHIFKVVINKKRVRNDFFIWLAEWFISEMEREVHGSTMQHLTADTFGGFPILLPPLSEQKKIASFLDRETSRIDRLIVVKQHLLGILNEKRQKIITNMITQGLNPNVLLHSSEIPWINKIPKHWNIKRAKWLFQERNERSTTGEEELLTVSHLTGVTPRSEKNVNMFEAETTEGYKLCEAGDLVINTMWAWMGAMGISPMRGVVSPSYNVYELGSSLFQDYIDAMVRMPVFTEEVKRHSKGVWSSRLRLYPEGFFKILLPIPPVEEQHDIVNYIKVKNAKLDAVGLAAENSIILLKERRRAIINYVVTGQNGGNLKYEGSGTHTH